MRILIVTDAWFPQTNGVVVTLAHTGAWLGRFGHEVRFITPRDFRNVACPTYPEIRLSVFPYRGMCKRIEAFRPQALHIATEGPLGLAARGFKNIARWQRGVDTQRFRPRDKNFLDLPRPIAAYVGRVAVEKNIGAFLSMPWNGTKLVIGDGPERERLQSLHPDGVYAGYRFGDDLAQHLAAADILVFPSLTDTFGLVNLEAMSCGVPVAAFPVVGPIDVIEDGVTGALDSNLEKAALRALRIDPIRCRERALRSGWDVCARQFESNLVACRKNEAPLRPRVPAVTGWSGAP